MSYFFELENFIAKPKEEILLIEPFKSIWKEDKSKNKETAIKKFSLIELYTSKKKSNPFNGYNNKEKLDKILEVLKSDENLICDKVKDGIKILEDLQTKYSPTYTYYLAALEATEKLKQFFLNFDISEVNPKTGLPIYKPKDITSALIDTEKALSNLLSLKDKVEQELYENTKNKGNKEINYFEI